ALRGDMSFQGRPTALLTNLTGGNVLNGIRIDLGTAPELAEQFCFFARVGTRALSLPRELKNPHWASDRAPESGTWKIGDLVWNRKPETNAPLGWVCVAAPDSFAPFGLVGDTGSVLGRAVIRRFSTDTQLEASDGGKVLSNEGTTGRVTALLPP